ncbi:hypothetical protein E4U57_000041 [Claviceps arundinis]|uniref:Uncharacterized protein n=1 Tax=Claviceps arundinis TaxID=1623583 RepID=A0ABQ7PQC7_9HYPO|nr:hypothetical protein E4U57_000041 [Claviceps arundinis]
MSEYEVLGHIVNPDLPDLDSDVLVKPAVLITPEQCLDFVRSKIQSRTGSSTAVSSATAETSHHVQCSLSPSHTAEYNLRSPKEQQIQLWISACVESNAYNTITSKLTSGTGRSDFSLRQLAKALKKKLTPGDYILKEGLVQSSDTAGQLGRDCVVSVAFNTCRYPKLDLLLLRRSQIVLRGLLSHHKFISKNSR